MLSSISFNQAGFVNAPNRNQSFGDTKRVLLRKLAEKGAETVTEGPKEGINDLAGLLERKIERALREGASEIPLHPSLERVKPGTRLAVTA